jgi:hypothetical protein
MEMRTTRKWTGPTPGAPATAPAAGARNATLSTHRASFGAKHGCPVLKVAPQDLRPGEAYLLATGERYRGDRGGVLRQKRLCSEGTCLTDVCRDMSDT